LIAWSYAIALMLSVIIRKFMTDINVYHPTPGLL